MRRVLFATLLAVSLAGIIAAQAITGEKAEAVKNRDTQNRR
jgi:hypothetical protein